MMMGLTIEKFPIPPINRRALDKMYEQVVFEDENTDYFDLISVSNLLQMLCRAHSEGQNCEAVKKHLVTLKEFIWMGPDGMQFTVTNGCQVWDTAFIVLGLIDSSLSEVEENQESLLRVLHWLDEVQITENPRYWPADCRQATKGAWYLFFRSLWRLKVIVFVNRAFSTKRENGYVVSDCTGEALKAILLLSHKLKYVAV